ncbi:FAD-dependent oxidoreductase [Glaciihabitans arcticus]|uniref:FAD-dependent oxidoreductase n=2 Tax=Glaciihabitans arcticus TaxID=2668039 RepID=A0A4Q9GZ17_9MICO|nr:FAD-dependent oxidoreductase [Glaciihabitans arcticus]
MGGLRVTEALRKSGYAGPITVIGDESHLPYNRPPLSKDVLSTVVSHEAVAFPQRAATANVDWMLGSPVSSVDVAAHTLATADGSTREWRALVVATGLRPRRLALPPLAGRHTLRTLDDAMALRDELVPGARVVVNGSGFIGSEVAATARKLGCEVTVVSSNTLPMERALGPVLGAEVQARHEAHGVEFLPGRSVVALLGESRVEGVVLDDGRELAADVVVEAIGADCNDEWLAASGLDLIDGVLVDPAMRAIGLDGTVHSDIYVVGDIARFPNTMFDSVPRRVEHWNIPTDTGRRAGAVLGAYLADDGSLEDVAAQSFTPMPSFWSNQFDLSIQAFGMPGLADPDGVRLLEGEISGDSITGYYRSGRLVGVVGFGMKAALMPYRAQIAAG